MAEILVTDAIPPACLDALAARWSVARLDRAADRDQVLSAVGASVRAVVGRNVPAGLIAALPALEIIANFGVGYDGVDIRAAAARGIRVTNTPDVLNDAVAELTLGLMLALARQLPQADAATRQGRWREGLGQGVELAGTTAGIVGLGRIGREIASRLAAMKMRVLYHGRQPQPGQPYEHEPALLTLAERSDWLVLALPGGAATAGLIGPQVLDALGRGGRLVNISRGGVLDEAALIERLRDGRLAGAALDVFGVEPARHADYADVPALVLSPHIGAATSATRAAMSRMVVDNLAAHFEGRAPPQLIEVR